MVCLLGKSLHGLKQSPRQWYKHFDDFTLKIRFHRSNFDHCVYFRKVRKGTFIYLLIYVDDMLVACKEKTEILRLKVILKIEFNMKDMGAAKRILGIDIIKDRKNGTLRLSQSGYLKKVLEVFGMQDSKPVNTPVLAHYILSSVKEDLPKEEAAYIKKVPYSNVVGSLMYAIISIRPDMAYGVSLVSRFMSKPSKDHWKAVKWLMRYIKGSLSVGLVYESRKEGGSYMSVYFDSDYAADLDKRRSITGYAFTVGGNLVSWKSNLQHIVALCTTEAKYMALIEAIKEAIWL